MATQHKQIDAETLENLLYLSRLSPESTNMETYHLLGCDKLSLWADIISAYWKWQSNCPCQ